MWGTAVAQSSRRPSLLAPLPPPPPMFGGGCDWRFRGLGLMFLAAGAVMLYMGDPSCIFAFVFALLCGLTGNLD
ncbi:hypothetical protein C2E20_1674 [Micractinium conductrix]|uniref:Uncharacterized protein n=1 Tax=Micractinium conductrix TaxID=554055 RepID=A0A2P6VMG9_9CHLO|nr:hypothetical protein C2E20_1674 [Micractinium conductrix]|eukprot:PSC75235.1 hypothetical protein C2E20_1674 [Micractinium conductrix]